MKSKIILPPPRNFSRLDLYSCRIWRQVQYIVDKVVNEICTITLAQAGMQANQFATAHDCAGNITNLTENCTGKHIFFSQESKETCS